MKRHADVPHRRQFTTSGKPFGTTFGRSSEEAASFSDEVFDELDPHFKDLILSQAIKRLEE